jgi:hypothetical protein
MHTYEGKTYGKTRTGTNARKRKSKLQSFLNFINDAKVPNRAPNRIVCSKRDII